MHSQDRILAARSTIGPFLKKALRIGLLWAQDMPRKPREGSYFKG